MTGYESLWLIEGERWTEAKLAAISVLVGSTVGLDKSVSQEGTITLLTTIISGSTSLVRPFIIRSTMR